MRSWYWEQWKVPKAMNFETPCEGQPGLPGKDRGRHGEKKLGKRGDKAKEWEGLEEWATVGRQLS